MALFHLTVTQVQRSAGQSAVASAAYRAGERLYSERYGEYSDYNPQGRRDLAPIFSLPPQAPPEYQEPADPVERAGSRRARQGRPACVQL